MHRSAAGLSGSRRRACRKTFSGPKNIFHARKKTFITQGEKLSAGRRKTFSTSAGETRRTCDPQMSRGQRRHRRQRFGQHRVAAPTCREAMTPPYAVVSVSLRRFGSDSLPIGTVPHDWKSPHMSRPKAPQNASPRPGAPNIFFSQKSRFKHSFGSKSINPCPLILWRGWRSVRYVSRVGHINQPTEDTPHA